MIRLFVFLAAGLFINNKVFAVEEPYLNELKGTGVAVGNEFTVADEKFINLSAWSLIQQNFSVDNIISFEIDFDSTLFFYGQPFDCTIQFKIYLYGDQADTSKITDSVTHADISLQVQYDTVSGKPYKGIAMYKFTGSHKYRVKILNINSPQLSPVLPIFRLKGQIIIDRQYIFEDESADVTRYSIINGNQLKLEWTPSNYHGAEIFDLEYTQIDGGSSIAASIRSFGGGGSYSAPEDSLAKWFLNNSTRVTTADAAYLLNIPYDSGFILFRIRGAQVQRTDGVRWEGKWNYQAREASDVCTSCPSGIVFFDPHEGNLNWQYSAAFAEEGKRKEVITYFDGTLRNRQSVTINNFDNKNIVQETIYDALGRAALNILPAPTMDSTLHYFRNFNRNSSGDPYSYADLLYDCKTTADSVNRSSGAGRYYSSNNEFINSYHYSKYIPDAGGYPFTVTEYTADNTGRVKGQGGVGPLFQLHGDHATRYFYGKPSQTELDRLFGSEAGYASHYLKNMVVDPNGQVSVSYINASGKTIASALAGAVPANLHALPSSASAVTQINDEVFNPEDFTRDAGNNLIISSTTFLAPVSGSYVFNYSVDPLKYEKLFGPDKNLKICNTCYYDLEINIKNECDSLLAMETREAGAVFDTSCTSPQTPITGELTVDIPITGEYYVTYKLVVSQDAIINYDTIHLAKNTDLKKLNYFLLDELKQTDFTGCFADCKTCFDMLGTKQEFVQRFQALYDADSVEYSDADAAYAQVLYDSLYLNCQSKQSECQTSICDEKLIMLKADVTPGGQYALYNETTGALLEPSINILARRNEITRFTNESGLRDSIILQNVDGQDSVKLDVKELNDAQFISYWKDVWADSLVRLHPEYCHYLWCTLNSPSYDYENELSNWLDADTAMDRGWFDLQSYDAIMNEDPFFMPGGTGYGLRTRMRDSLRLFSRTFARTSLSDKNILEFIDAALYCKNVHDGWNNCMPDSACRSRNREWFLYRQLYFNLKLLFYEEARRTHPNAIFANCVNCYIGKDLLGLAGIKLPVSDAGAAVSFDPGYSCVNTCGAGTYPSYGRPGISVHIEFGSPATPPSSVPLGYGGCRFYSAYDLATGPTTTCQFVNVWVCTYDTACGGICNVNIPLRSYCPDDPNAALYANKVRRYPEYVDASGFIDDILSSNPQQQADSSKALMESECRSGCEAQAEIWIKQLSGCNGNAGQMQTLKQALVDICAKGCTLGGFAGTSTLPDTIAAVYHSFEQAIASILGAGALNAACTAELLSSPYPHNRQPVYAQQIISETGYEICQQVTRYRNEWQESGAGGTFHEYMLERYTKGYDLDSAELNDLVASCTTCNGLLKNDILLPALFAPGATTCLSCDSMQIALTAFQAKFPGLNNSNDNYELLFANFMNHSFGYSLTYDEYTGYLDSCTAFGSYNVLLCNKPATPEATVEANGNSCMAELFTHALTNANITYVAYIDSVRREFREAYLSKCMGVAPSLTLTADLFEYHYTLYYYDQSGNLVKTIPPEGVALLNNDSIALVKQQRASQGTPVFPLHGLPTVYEYNSLNQVVKQFTPDGDTSQFYYDRLGRLTASQNREQKDRASYSASANRYSYTKYDVLGRIQEVGEKSEASSDITSIDLLDTTAVINWMASGTDKQITKTLYDEPIDITWQSSATSRKRVVATIYLENGDDEVNDSTLYRYDINGNVKTLKQFIKALAAVDTNRYRQIDYDYDLVSGKVNKVSYQFGKGDQFFYRYNYDAENRLRQAYSSRDGLVWNEEASYSYYLHGPLARTELGKLKVQGMDYAYTLQGWLKGINADGLNPALEIGQDGQSGTTFDRVSRDVFAMQLGYYQQDYNSIGAGTAFASRQYQPPSLLEATGNQLFNGNISYTTVSMKGINNDSTTGYTYGYDQLNRLLEMRQHTVSGNWSNGNILDAYRESVAYDANGNILKYLRHGANQPGRPLEMDSLNYKYNRGVHGRLVNNKLNYVTDQVNAEAYLPDIDNEKPDNYRYDKIGNLIRDRAEGIDTIKWTVYGKIHQIVKATGDVITYGYDAGGNRTSKQVTYTDTTVSTYYLRDAQGNVLAVYGHTSYNNEVKWKEQHLYGSSRLGMWRSDTVVSSAPPVVQNNGTLYDSLLYGARTYELNNHLGNVMVTISDKKVGVDSAADGTVAYYAADVRTAQDYYPFGMLMPGRMTYEGDYRWVPVDPSQIPEDVPVDLVLDQPRVSGDPAEYKATNSITMQPDFSSMTGDEFLAHIVEDDGLDPSDYATASRYSGVHSDYRYGFNGKENDDNVKGTGNQQDYGMRIYDSRLGRFLSEDPLAKKFAQLTPYQFASNTPIQAIDLDGLESINVNTGKTDNTLNPNSIPIYQNNDDATPWADLIKFKPPSATVEAANKRIVGSASVQKIETGSGEKINLDYYSVTIDKLPNGFDSPEQFYTYFRTNLSAFLSGGGSEFEPYNPTEGMRWKSSNPLSTIMAFQINTPIYNLDDASVLTSQYSSNYWTFSPVTTLRDFGHPVSGNRQFGITTNDNGTFTLFTRGADRIHAPIDRDLGGNTIFEGANLLWTTTMSNLANFINTNGGKAKVNDRISKRINWNSNLIK